MGVKHVSGLSLDAERLTVHYCGGNCVFNKEYKLMGTVFGKMSGTFAARGSA